MRRANFGRAADAARPPDAPSASEPTADVAAAGGAIGASCTGQTIKLSKNTTIAYTATGTPATSYKITGSNSSGTPKTYCYNSATGGSVIAAATC